MAAPFIMSSKIGTDGMFYGLGVIQLTGSAVFTLFLRETQGLSSQEKKRVYCEAEKEQI